jgi:hypothetical protein
MSPSARSHSLEAFLINQRKIFRLPLYFKGTVVRDLTYQTHSYSNLFTPLLPRLQ